VIGTRLSFFVHLTATPAWLVLSRPERQSIIAEHVEQLLRSHDVVAVRWFDAEAWAGVAL
jgi:hypothetical protein